METIWRCPDITQWHALENFPADAMTLVCHTILLYKALVLAKRTGTGRPQLPPYLKTSLPLSQRFLISRFRLMRLVSAHPVSVNMGDIMDPTMSRVPPLGPHEQAQHKLRNTCSLNAKHLQCVSCMLIAAIGLLRSIHLHSRHS